MQGTTEQIGFMRVAIGLAAENVGQGGGPFGAVVVRDGKIIGSGVNRVTALLDPTAHAEINAIREACRNLESWQLEGCEIYSSCEPCPMCLGAIYWARPAALYFANTREDAAAIQFDDGFIYRELQQPPASRSIPTFQFLRDEGLSVFATWESVPNKIRY